MPRKIGRIGRCRDPPPTLARVMHASAQRQPVGLVVATLVAVMAGGRVAAANTPDREAFFESRVRPLLVAKCQECHGTKLSEAGLRLDSRPALLAGGQSGPVAIAGSADHSRLIAAVRGAGDLQMPPDEPLAADEVAILEQWVADGMPWSGPGSGGPDDPLGVAAKPLDMDARLREALASHWALKPPCGHAPPPVPDGLPEDLRAAWSHSRIDRFLLAGMAPAGLTPSPPAPPRDLVRRLWFDLVGLPPPAAEVDAFCRDPSAAAYAALVERLLASREHAEHWARKWLDLARYADTMGYAFDGQASGYPFAWTYRDWVVKALHEDVPYDRFVTLQLAADLVEPAVPPADLAALGFLTVGRTFLGNTHDIIDDRIDLVTRGLLGLTAACARCHDHKYEPVTMADYYALHGIFSSSRIPAELPVIGPPPPGPEAEAFARKLAELEARVAEHEQAVHARAAREAIAHAADYLLETSRPLPRPDGRPPRLADGYEIEQLIVDRLTRTVDGLAADHPILGGWAAVRRTPDDQFAAALAGVFAGWEGAGGDAVNPAIQSELVSAKPATPRALAEAYARVIQRAVAAEGTPADTADLAAIRAALASPGAPLVVLPTEAMRVARREEQIEHRKRKRDITNHQATAPGGPPRAMVLRDTRPHDSRILLRGNPGRPGDLVPRRLPAVLGGGEVNRQASGRLELAQAIVAPTNPLTPRVVVDWVWRHHVGTGLVATPGDLGLRGEPPTHPELLDDLARRFVEEGAWSLRWLHREIVTSRAWRQASGIRPDHVAVDPDNRLLARALRRRLDWEAWRDALCSAAGSLDLTHPGGQGIDPLATDRMHARSLYARLDRQDVPGLLKTFDIANPDTAVHARVRTTVPQQALAALNAPLVVEAARRLAARAAGEAAGDDGAFVTSVWRAALARNPTAEERALALEWLAAEESQPAQPFGPRERLAQAVLATAEFEFID
jgi:cytochrome c553